MKPNQKWMIIGAVAMLALAAMCCCCGGVIWSGKRMIEQAVYPKADGMPAVVTPDMSTLLSKLEARMKKKAPKALAALAPGLKSEEIASLEAKYNIQLSPELKQLYMWRNGAVDADKGAEIVPLYGFPSLENALQKRETFNKEVGSQGGIFVGHQKSWLCVMGDDESGGYYFDPARTEAEGAFFLGYRDEVDFTFFPSVRNFIAGVVECYEKDLYKETSEGLEEEDDIDKLDEVWKKYGKATYE
jgi:hypothetical protein